MEKRCNPKGIGASHGIALPEQIVLSFYSWLPVCSFNGQRSQIPVLVQHPPVLQKKLNSDPQLRAAAGEGNRLYISQYFSSKNFSHHKREAYDLRTLQKAQGLATIINSVLFTFCFGMLLGQNHLVVVLVCFILKWSVREHPIEFDSFLPRTCCKNCRISIGMWLMSSIGANGVALLLPLHLSAARWAYPATVPPVRLPAEASLLACPRAWCYLHKISPPAKNRLLNAFFQVYSLVWTWFLIKIPQKHDVPKEFNRRIQPLLRRAINDGNDQDWI